MRGLLLMLAAVVAWAGPAAAQDTERPDFATHRFDEDWRSLCDPAQRTEPLDPLKCITLSPDTTLTLGGEWRERLELARNPRYGLAEDSESALLHRVLLHADLRTGSSVRAFVQLGYFDQSGRDRGPAPTDVDRLDVTQAFIDLSAPIAGGSATLRGGRQELSFGSQRLVSTREGPNIRRSYDGARGFWTGSGARADVFHVQPVAIERGTFDDGTDDAEALWGAYLTGPVPGAGPLNADLYYLGYRRDDARFAAGVADERRHTLGVRLFGERDGFDWDVEAAYQFGSFGAADLNAWTVASDFGYTFASRPLAPRLGFKADIASGDSDARDGRFGTFNALFPKLPYFSEAGLVAPANIMDLHPSLGLELGGGGAVELGWNALWRHRTADAVYSAPLLAVPSTAGRPGRFIGHQMIVGAEWRMAPGLTLSGQYVHFWRGDALRRAGGRDVDFLVTSVALRF